MAKKAEAKKKAKPKKKVGRMELYDPQTKEPLYLSEDETRCFLHSAGIMFKKKPRYYALCYLLAATGMRISEALPLKQSNFSIRPGDPHPQVLYRTLKQFNPVTKKNMERYNTVPLLEKVRQVLLANTNWGQDPAGASKLMFPSEYDENRMISRVYAYQLIKEVMVAAGIPANAKRCCVKGLRHGFAIQQIKNGNSHYQVQRWLGHASPKTTAIYTRACTDVERQLLERGINAALPDIDAPLPDIIEVRP